MIDVGPKTQFDSIVSLIEAVNQLVEDMTGGELLAFHSISLRRPRLDIPIHGFYTTVSWLYILYHEAGRITVEFLAERASALQLDPKGQLGRHIKLISSLRTYLQHNLDTRKRNDLAIRQHCHSWTAETLRAAGLSGDIDWPRTSRQWRVLLAVLLHEVMDCLKIMYATVEAIRADESCQDTIRVWKSRVKRWRAPHEYDDIIRMAASDMGLTSLDPTALRMRHYDKWNNKLKLLREDHDFDREARLLVEQSLINEEQLPIPLSGEDIMQEFEISPGPRVRELKILAQKLYIQQPRDRELLLAALRDAVEE